MTERRKRRRRLGCIIAVASCIILILLIVALVYAIIGYINEKDNLYAVSGTRVELTDIEKDAIISQMGNFIKLLETVTQSYLPESSVTKGDIFASVETDGQIRAYMFIFSGKYVNYKNEAYELCSHRNLYYADVKKDNDTLTVTNVWECPLDKDREELINKRFPKFAREYALSANYSTVMSDVTEAAQSSLGCKLSKNKLEIDAYGTVTVIGVEQGDTKNGTSSYSTHIISQERLE